ncbi:MAG: hypothetical protein H6838_03170 [Planctomycetes bacterium]|nr:hypothetical protein [Planctomycetota bacterium]
MATARAVALQALVELDRGRASRLRAALDAAGLEGREQALANELAHGVLRRERLLDHVLEGLAERGLPRDPRLRLVLRLGAYQLLFVGGMPAHAAVNETVRLIKGNRGFANAVLRQIARRIELRVADPTAATTELPLSPTRTLLLPKPLPEDLAARLAIEHSLPDFLVSRWRQQFGDDALPGITAAASTVPDVYLRVSAAGSRDQLLAALAAAGVSAERALHPRLLRWTGGESPFGTEAFRLGLFAVQDPTALAAAEAVPCGPGDRVVDLCAAPGTKTGVLAERVRPGGTVFAADPDARRRERIAENVQRLGLREVVRIVADADLPTDVDAVLADVPCSNSGVLARRVEVRRRLEPGTFPELAALQLTILERAAGLVRPGGHVVYSTCSIDREENEAVVARLLETAAGRGFELLTQATTLPQAGHHDGGFVAVLRRGLSGGSPEG